jgi:hypothetical protein
MLAIDVTHFDAFLASVTQYINCPVSVIEANCDPKQGSPITFKTRTPFHYPGFQCPQMQETGCGAHTTSYSMGTGIVFPEGKESGA